MRKHKKYKPQKFGLNPKWVERYILMPLTTISLLAIIVVVAKINYNTYALQQESIRQEQQILEEKQRQEEEKKREEKELQESINAREKKYLTELQTAKVESRKSQTIQEDKIAKKYLYSYYKNEETKLVGKAIKNYGLEIITDSDLTFTITDDGELPKEITMIGWKEYANKMEKQIKKEKDPQKEYQLNKAYKEEFARQTEITKDKFPKNTYWEYKGKKYFVKDWNGGNVILQNEKDKKPITICRDEPVRKLTPKEYYIVGEKK